MSITAIQMMPTLLNDTIFVVHVMRLMNLLMDIFNRAARTRHAPFRNLLLIFHRQGIPFNALIQPKFIDIVKTLIQFHFGLIQTLASIKRHQVIKFVMFIARFWHLCTAYFLFSDVFFLNCFFKRRNIPNKVRLAKIINLMKWKIHLRTKSA